MNRRSRRLLPPVTALASFEAAAKYESFSKAGTDVGLTQSAISRQIRLLEDWLQLPLFRRVGRGVELTAQGSAYAEAIAPALNKIRAATAQAIDRRPDHQLNIATLPSFGMRWFMPRLTNFAARHPDIVIDVAARSYAFDFKSEQFDGAIHFGFPDWPDASHDFLFREEAVPVCSPDRLAQFPINNAADVLGWPLLSQTSRPSAWTEWFHSNGVDAEIPTPVATIEHFLMLSQAAVAGSGIALIPKFLIVPELESGVLTSPLPHSFYSEKAYYFVYPETNDIKPALAQLRDWLLLEATRPCL